MGHRRQPPSVIHLTATSRIQQLGSIGSDITRTVNPPSEWPNTTRFVWITGGVSATSEAGHSDVIVHSGMRGPEICVFEIDSYPSIYTSLRLKGFDVIGVTFIDEFSKAYLRRPDFRVYALNRGWMAWDTKQKWRQIAFGAGKTNQMDLMDLAARIAAGLTYSESRLGDLARAYSFQLGARLRQGGIKDYEVFEDFNSLDVFKSIHSLFWELAVLRDTLAQFAARYCFSQPAIRSMSRLRRMLANPIIEDPIAKELLRATDEASGGWLAEFSTYRNCFTHLASLDQAEGHRFAVQDVQGFSASSKMPQIYYPLPNDIKALYAKRSTGLPFNSLEELRVILSRRHDRGKDPDALEYLHRCMIAFTELSLTLIHSSPLAPKPIRLGPEDMRSDVNL